jgi:ABC-type dipeptide/oligopeptide/nickel transport system ATPase component
MPKISKVGKFRKAAAEAATPANTPVSKGAQVAPVARPHPLANNVYLTVDKATTTASTTDANSNANTDASNVSRGQRKRQAKRDQYLRKEKLILSSLKLKTEQEQKKRIDGLDAIKEALLATVKKSSSSSKAGTAVQTDNIEDKEEEKPNMLKTSKSRQLLMQKEVAQMSLVLQHPAFQADPFATIREHLTNTLAKDSANNKKEQAQHLRERKEKEEKKKAVKKEQGIKKKKGKKFKATRSRGK